MRVRVFISSMLAAMLLTPIFATQVAAAAIPGPVNNLQVKALNDLAVVTFKPSSDPKKVNLYKVEYEAGVIGIQPGTLPVITLHKLSLGLHTVTVRTIYTDGNEFTASRTFENRPAPQPQPIKFTRLPGAVGFEIPPHTERNTQQAYTYTIVGGNGAYQRSNRGVLTGFQGGDSSGSGVRYQANFLLGKDGNGEILTSGPWSEEVIVRTYKPVKPLSNYLPSRVVDGDKLVLTWKHTLDWQVAMYQVKIGAKTYKLRRYEQESYTWKIPLPQGWTLSTEFTWLMTNIYGTSTATGTVGYSYSCGEPKSLCYRNGPNPAVGSTPAGNLGK